VGALSEKLKPVSSDVIQVDFDSFSEPEKQLCGTNEKKQRLNFKTPG
jgi:hypothetical protein